MSYYEQKRLIEALTNHPEAKNSFSLLGKMSGMTESHCRNAYAELLSHGQINPLEDEYHCQ